MASNTLHGVNLTGWLTLESWVTPELFAEVGALDEEQLASSLGPRRYADYVRNHRATFVTREDFARIAARGFNAVRLPVPWYVYGDDGPEPGRTRAASSSSTRPWSGRRSSACTSSSRWR